MHFLCSTFGSAGDVFPMLGLALELRRRGHAITFATNAYFEETIRRHDLPFEPLGTREDFLATIRSPDLWHPQKAFGHVFRSLEPVLRRQYEIHAAYAGSRDTVAVTNCFGLGAFMAQEMCKVPAVTLHCQPAVIWSRYDPPGLPGVMGPRWFKRFLYWVGTRFVINPEVKRRLNPWRAELGLPPLGDVTSYWHSPYGVLCLFPDWFAPPQPDWPGNLMQADFPLWNDRSDAGLSDEVERFLNKGDAPLVFTPGSANIHGSSFFQAAIEACCTLGRRGVLLSEFPEQIPANLPESVAYFRYVPLDQLLPRSAAFIHHGGVGSTSQALAAGVPQVIMPLAHDQFDNAQRVKRLGVGASLGVSRFTGRRLANLLRSLLDDPAGGSKRQECADRLMARDGIARAASLLEQRVARAL